MPDATFANRRLAFACSDADLARVWAYGGQRTAATLPFPADDQPRTPFPDRRSIPYEPPPPPPPPPPAAPVGGSPGGRAPPLPLPLGARLSSPPPPPASPARSHDQPSSPPCPATPPDKRPRPRPRAPSPFHSPAHSPSHSPAHTPAHTQVHLLDFVSDASVDALRRGRVLALHLGAAARHVLVVRTDAAFAAGLFPECGVLLTLDPGVARAPMPMEMEIVVAIEVVRDWAGADAALAALAGGDGALDGGGGRRGGHGGHGDYGKPGGGGDHGPGAGCGADGDGDGDGVAGVACVPARRVELVRHDDADVYLLPGAGPGFANWLLAGLADALEAHGGVRVTFAGVRAWDARWVRPHWAGAIVEDLLRLSADAAARLGPMRIHLHSGIKQAGRSQHVWGPERVRSIRDERVAYLDEDGWARLRAEIGLAPQAPAPLYVD